MFQLQQRQVIGKSAVADTHRGQEPVEGLQWHQEQAPEPWSVVPAPVGS